MHPNSHRFHALLAEISSLHKQKSADYGAEEDPFANVRASEDFGIPGWIGAVVRANDKMRRLMSFARKGELVNEPVEDSLLDLASYCLIALVLYEEEQDAVLQTEATGGGAAGARLVGGCTSNLPCRAPEAGVAARAAGAAWLHGCGGECSCRKPRT